MNPFDLRGPEFLVFYLFLIGVVMLMIVLIRRWLESGPPPVVDITDPYFFACLRGGAREALLVSTLNLLDRGLLKRQGDDIRADPAARVEGSELEGRVLEHFKAHRSLPSLLEGLSLAEPVIRYEDQLRALGLVPGEQAQRLRFLTAVVAVLALVTVAVLKIGIALIRGRSNVSFLIILAVIGSFAVGKIANPFRTALGEAVLTSVRGMFSDLRGRADSIGHGRATSELLWLAALFGIATVPTLDSEFLKARVRRIQLSSPPGSSYGYSSCGSSCGSGCGGGGCGGGCGGCGS